MSPVIAQDNHVASVSARDFPYVTYHFEGPAPDIIAVADIVEAIKTALEQDVLTQPSHAPQRKLSTRDMRAIWLREFKKLPKLFAYSA